MANAPEMDIYSASFENNLHTGYISVNTKIDQNNLESQNNVDLETTFHDILTNNGINSCEVSVETKLELHTGGQNCNILAHDSKTEIVNNNYQISSNKYMPDILTNIDRQLPKQDVNTEYNIIDFQDNSDHFTDSGCFSSESTIDNGSDMLLKEYMNTKNDLTSINESHMVHPYDVKNVNFVKNFTLDNEFKDNDDLDSNCSGYNSSDFEFIDENEAKMFNIIELNTDIVNKSDVCNEASLNFPKDSFNCLNHLKAEGDDFLVLFQTQAHKFDFVEHCNFVPSTSRPRLRFEIEKFECKDSEDDVRNAKETEKNIFSMYPRQNRYYKGIL